MQKQYINDVIETKEAYNELDDVVLDDKFTNLLKNPSVIKNIMKVYELEWKCPEITLYADRVQKFEEIYNNPVPYENPKDGKIYSPDEIAEMAMLKVINLKDARPSCQSHIESLKGKGTADGYTVESVKEELEMAAEGEGEYGYAADTKCQCSDWVSCRTSSEKPKSGEAVVLAGYHLPGLLIYKIAFWLSDEYCWDVPDIPEGYSFTPLYWKSIGAAPTGYINEI